MENYKGLGFMGIYGFQVILKFLIISFFTDFHLSNIQFYLQTLPNSFNKNLKFSKISKVFQNLRNFLKFPSKNTSANKSTTISINKRTKLYRFPFKFFFKFSKISQNFPKIFTNFPQKTLPQTILYINRQSFQS